MHVRARFRRVRRFGDCLVECVERDDGRGGIIVSKDRPAVYYIERLGFTGVTGLGVNSTSVVGHCKI